METNFYKSWTENLELRGKEKKKLQNEAVQLREKCTSQLVQLQDVVHPKKWITLAEAKLRIQNEAERLKEMNDSALCNFNEDSFTTLQVDTNELETVIKQADDLLRENETSDTVEHPL